MVKEKKEKLKPTLDTTLDPMKIIQPTDDDMKGYEVVVMTATEFRKKREATIKHLVSGTPLDALMKLTKPGMESGSVYLIYGANNVGKTQFSNTVAVLTKGDVIWVDGGEKTFRPERIRQIARLRGLDPDYVESKIHIVHAINASHLEAICSKLPRLFMRFKTKKDEDGVEYKERAFIKKRLVTGAVTLVVLDSIAPTFRAQYQGRGRLNPRQQAILRVIMFLRLMSQWFNCVVLVTDQIIADPGGMPYGGPWNRQNPVGGPTVTHNIDFQVMMRPGKQNIRVAKVMDSSNTPMGEIEFMITDKGVEMIAEDEDE